MRCRDHTGLAAHDFRPCCPMHMLMFMDAERRPAPSVDEPAPSFLDGPSKQTSRHCNGSDEQTRDLYQVAERGRPVVIRGGNLVTMGGAGTLREHDLICVDGVIQGVQPSGGPVNSEAIFIDASGGYIIPGLSEMHTHPALFDAVSMYAPAFGVDDPGEMLLPYDLLMFLYLAGGVTRLEVMAGTPEYLALRDHIRAGRMRGPMMRIASPLIDGWPLFWGPQLTWAVSDVEGARLAAREIKARGYDFAKPYTRLAEEPYWALIEECDALGIPVIGHIPTAVDVEQALTRGQRGVAHIFEYFCHEPQERKLDPEVIARKAKLSAGRNMVVQTTMVAGRTLEYDVGLAPDAIDAADFLDPLYRNLLHDDSPFLKAWRDDPKMVHAGRDCFRASVEMTKALVSEGVRILPGTDMPPNLTRSLSTHDELQIFVEEVGMSPLEALRSATMTSADHQGEADVSGTLDQGKRSDLVILGADPTEKIGATRDIQGVMIGNAFLSRAALDTGIERANAIYARMPIPNPYQ